MSIILSPQQTRSGHRIADIVKQQLSVSEIDQYGGGSNEKHDKDCNKASAEKEILLGLPQGITDRHRRILVREDRRIRKFGSSYLIIVFHSLYLRYNRNILTHLVF